MTTPDPIPLAAQTIITEQAPAIWHALQHRNGADQGEHLRLLIREAAQALAPWMELRPAIEAVGAAVAALIAADTARLRAEKEQLQRTVQTVHRVRKLVRRTTAIERTAIDTWLPPALRSR